MGAYTWREESESCILSPTTCLPISRVRSAGSFLGLMFSAPPKTPRSSGRSQSSRTGSTGPGQREAGAISKSLLPLGPGPPYPAGFVSVLSCPLSPCEATACGVTWVGRLTSSSGTGLPVIPSLFPLVPEKGRTEEAAFTELVGEEGAVGGGRVS